MPGVVIKGVVQGVGFRPFVYRLAKRFGLRGYIRNLGDSVEVYVHRESPEFIAALKKEKPPLAEIESIEIIRGEEKEYSEFSILESSSGKASGSSLPPDLAICDTCLKEIFDSRDRRYLYPFTVCTDCGPRFSIIEALPYDRTNTSMKSFKLCRHCLDEYTSPESRRFKAEPTACGECGPSYELYRGSEKSNGNPIRKAAELLEESRILAIKGVGGTHLACLATSSRAVKEMRRRLGREKKPFAVMVRDIKAARKLVFIGKEEETLLESRERPILLLKKRVSEISELVAPQLHTLGVMLPYAGVHYLLFNYMNSPTLVMSSCNAPGEPMASERKDVLKLGFHDYALLHNRRIVNRIDDSILRVVRGRRAFIRRSRGYVPGAVSLKRSGPDVLSLGAEENVTACFLVGKKAYLTQYIGKTTSPSTLEFLEGSVKRMKALSGAYEIEAIACDLHPGFQTTQLAEALAEEQGLELFKIQHHEAHIAGVAAEKGIEEGIGIALDGFGYGYSGEAWGGEIFFFSGSDFNRAGSMKSFPLIGGDSAVRNPLRITAGLLLGELEEEEVNEALTALGMESFEVEILLKQWNKNFNVFQCSSFARVLDAVSALLGVCRERTYEGEPAMKLESFAHGVRPELDMPVMFEREGKIEVFNSAKLLKACLDYLNSGESREKIAASAQKALATGMAGLAAVKAQDYGVKDIVLSGGVAYNEVVVGEIENVFNQQGLRLSLNENVARGDNGLSLGQSYLARLRI